MVGWSFLFDLEGEGSESGGEHLEGVIFPRPRGRTLVVRTSVEYCMHKGTR